MAGTQFTIVTPCKGRRRYLERALPTFRIQASCTVVVVDYDCPDGTAEWIGATYPDVQVVKVREAPVFNLSRSRNLGAAVATTPWLVFCDADNMLDPAFTRRIASVARPGTFLRAVFQGDQGLQSRQVPLVCETAVFAALGGYDDAIEGWGPEDLELSRRLNQHGLAPLYFPMALVTVVEHEDSERTRFYTQDQRLSRLVGHYYVRVKERYYATRGLDFTDAQRYGTYRRIREVVTTATSAEGGSEALYAVDVPGADPPWTAHLRAADILRSRVPPAPTR
ncbi:MAG: glycosyltransferase [Casimicrobiaceae bacterium]